MAVIYVKEQGSVIRKIGERIVVEKNGKTLLDIPIIKITNLSVIGNVQLTTQALTMLLENGIDISYFTYSGKYLGHTGADSSKNIFLRFEQHEFYLDEEKRLGMAKTIVNNKILNQIELIQSHRWSAESDYDWKADVKKMEELRLLIPEKKISGQILGVEGICSNIYFGAFARMLKGDFVFKSRNRRPPKDPVNVILSLGYTFLTREICNALDAESFETYLGFLHGIRYGRKSLALDVIEEFRQPVIDRLTMLLLGKRMISQFDFDMDDSGRIILNEGGFRKFCTEYERWMTGRNSVAGDHFRKRIQEQIAMLKRVFVRDDIYIPYHWSEQHVSD